MKLTLMFVLFATVLALSIASPAPLPAEAEELRPSQLEVEAVENPSAKNKRAVFYAGYSPYAYSAYSYPYAAAYPYSAYSYGYPAYSSAYRGYGYYYL